MIYQVNKSHTLHFSYYSVFMLGHLISYLRLRPLLRLSENQLSVIKQGEQDGEGQHQSAVMPTLLISVLMRSSRTIDGGWMRELSQRSGCRVVDVGGEWFIHEATNAPWMRDVALCITARKNWDFGCNPLRAGYYSVYIIYQTGGFPNHRCISVRLHCFLLC